MRLPFRIVALNVSDGSPVWNSSDPSQGSDQCGGYASSPVASRDGTLVVATMCDNSLPGTLRALRAADGTDKWSISNTNLRPIVNFFGDPDVTISPDGTAVFVWGRVVDADSI